MSDVNALMFKSELLKTYILGELTSNVTVETSKCKDGCLLYINVYGDSTFYISLSNEKDLYTDFQDFVITLSGGTKLTLPEFFKIIKNAEAIGIAINSKIKGSKLKAKITNYPHLGIHYSIINGYVEYNFDTRNVSIVYNPDHKVVQLLRNPLLANGYLKVSDEDFLKNEDDIQTKYVKTLGELREYNKTIKAEFEAACIATARSLDAKLKEKFNVESPQI